LISFHEKEKTLLAHPLGVVVTAAILTVLAVDSAAV